MADTIETVIFSDNQTFDGPDIITSGAPPSD
jgi:hypothetical protein